MTTSFTPGPWRVGKRYGGVVADKPPTSARFSDHYTAASEVEAYGGYLIAESIAPENRDLIAAAPELYEALDRLVRAGMENETEAAGRAIYGPELAILAKAREEGVTA